MKETSKNSPVLAGTEATAIEESWQTLNSCSWKMLGMKPRGITKTKSSQTLRIQYIRKGSISTHLLWFTFWVWGALPWRASQTLSQDTEMAPTSFPPGSVCNRVSSVWKHYTLLINVGKRTILQSSRNFQIHNQQQLLIRKPNLIRGLFWQLGHLEEKESKGIGCGNIQWGYREAKCFYGDFTCPCLCSLNLLLQLWKIEKLPLWTLGIPRSYKNMPIRNRAKSLEEYAKTIMTK